MRQLPVGSLPAAFIFLVFALIGCRKNAVEPGSAGLMDPASASTPVLFSTYGESQDVSITSFVAVKSEVAGEFSESQRQHLTMGPDKSKYVPDGYTNHILTGPDVSKYLPPGYVSHLGTGPDATKYVPRGYTGHLTEGADASKYTPPGYNAHLESGPDKTKYVPQGYYYHIISGPNASKYSNTPQRAAVSVPGANYLESANDLATPLFVTAASASNALFPVKPE